MEQRSDLRTPCAGNPNGNCDRNWPWVKTARSRDQDTQCTQFADTYFILKDFHSYADAQKRVMEAYKDEEGWAKSAILNIAHAGKFSSDRTIQEYVDDIWHLDKITVEV